VIECHYWLHGVGLTVKSGSKRMENRVDRALEVFRGSSPGPGATALVLRTLPAKRRLEAFLPAKAELLHSSRVWPNERMRYWMDGPDLYIEAVRRCLVRFRWADKKITVWLGRSAAWDMGRLLIYPVCYELLRHAGLFPMHAAAAARNGDAVIFSGRGGSGKSTSAVALVRAGFELLSDDLILLRSGRTGLRVFSWPQRVRVTKKTAMMVPEIAHLRHSPGRLKKDFSLREVYGRDHARSARPRLILFLELTRRPGHSVVPLTQAGSLCRLLPNSLYIVEPETAARHFDAVARLSAECRSYVLRCGTNIEDLPAFVSRLLAGCP